MEKIIYIFKSDKLCGYDVGRKKTNMIWSVSTNRPLKHIGNTGYLYFKLRKDIIETVI